MWRNRAECVYPLGKEGRDESGVRPKAFADGNLSTQKETSRMGRNAPHPPPVHTRWSSDCKSSPVALLAGFVQVVALVFYRKKVFILVVPSFKDGDERTT